MIQSDSEMKYLTTSVIDKKFPHFSEVLKRKWTKEYTISERKGKDTIYKLKPRTGVMSEEDMRRLVTPESVCIHEFMLFNEQRLSDLGVGNSEEESLKHNPDWILSRNYIQAIEGKGVLDLTGEGDRSGIGDSISFSKMRVKKENEKKILNDPNQFYKKEIEEIHRKLERMFSSPTPPKKPNIKINSDYEDTEGEFLTIKRYYKNGNETVEDVEIIKNPYVIKLYLKKKQKEKDIINNTSDNRKILTCGSCKQPGHMKTNKQCPNYVESTKLSVSGNKNKKLKKILNEKIISSINELFRIDSSEAFHKPVSSKLYPNYKNVIEKPIDLSSIKAKARRNEYKLFSEYLDDLSLLKNNCVQFNGVSHPLTNIAGMILDKGRDYLYENKSYVKEIEEKMLKEND